MKNKFLKLSFLPIMLCISGCNAKDFSPKIDESLIGKISERKTYQNIFKNDRIPDQIQGWGAGDPFVYRWNGMYYLYPSALRNPIGVKAWKSKDLMTWEPCNASGIGQGLVTDEPCTEVAYAPEVIYINGKFYMCESMGGDGHYILESDSPEGPFVKTQDNFGESIDGSFFLDDDEQAYFLRAGTNGIRMIKFNDDMTISSERITIESASMSGWTEGPYMLKKDGNYFLTYTGIHVNSNGYRVAYAYHESNNEIPMFRRDSFKFGSNILQACEETYRGLGHSSTVLGPNMDSYYICYHCRDYGRAFNINRLMFNGTEMSVPYYALDNNIAPQMPEFSTDNVLFLVPENNFLLSDKASENCFTCEFNFIGEDVKNVFSYNNENDYCYATMSSDNKLTIHNVSNGVDLEIASHQMKKNYDFSKLHTIRISYSDNKLDCFFDTMNVISTNATLKGGKIGYDSRTIESKNIFYTAFSNAAHDSSQKDDFKQHQILQNTYDNEISTVTIDNETIVTSENYDASINQSKYMTLDGKNYATYKIYANEDGYYKLDVRVPVSSMGKTLKFKIDNEEYQQSKIPTFNSEETEIKVPLGSFNLTKGTHYLTVFSNEKVSYRYLEFYKSIKRDYVEKTYSLNMEEEDINYVNENASKWQMKDSKLFTSKDNRSMAILTDNVVEDCSVEVTINFTEEMHNGTAGIALRAGVAAFSNEHDDEHSLQGFYIGLNKTKIFIDEENYNMTIYGVRESIDIDLNKDYVLKAVVKGQTIEAYLDGQLMVTYTTSFGNTHGYAALYSSYSSVKYSNCKLCIGNQPEIN